MRGGTDTFPITTGDHVRANPSRFEYWARTLAPDPDGDDVVT
jgi:hypothetical protein